MAANVSTALGEQMGVLESFHPQSVAVPFTRFSSHSVRVLAPQAKCGAWVEAGAPSLSERIHVLLGFGYQENLVKIVILHHVLNSVIHLPKSRWELMAYGGPHLLPSKMNAESS
jgi:hypothetical protein